MPRKLIKGSIRFRPDLNTYEARIMINYKRKSIYDKDKNVCIKKANEFYKSHYKTISIEYSQKDSPYFNDWIDTWYNLYKSKKLKESSKKTMLSAINKYIKPYFKKTRLTQINALIVDNFLYTFENSRHKETVCTILCDCIKTAYKKEKLKKPIHEFITKYKHTREEGHCLTPEEERIFLDNWKKVKYAEIVYFAYLTGCRKHGALNLRKCDIDFINKQIHLRETKTKNSDRIIPMSAKVEQFLKTLDLTKDKLLYISDRQFKNMIDDLSKICKFRIHIKDMRTTFASRAREKGVAPEVLQKWLGHANYGITEKYYVKVSNNFEMQQIKLLD